MPKERQINNVLNLIPRFVSPQTLPSVLWRHRPRLRLQSWLLYFIIVPKYLLIGILLSILTGKLAAQELNATVRVNAENVSLSEPRLVQEMQTEFQEFLNNRKWTEDTYGPKERINCNFLINLTASPSVGRYEATVQVQSSRPVYGSGYETVMLNFADRDWSFEYVESQQMNFNPNNYLNEVTSLLAYYAYMVLGYDYDSFSELGGSPHFERAQQVVQTATAASGRAGWDQFSGNAGRNRYALMNNMINPQMEPIRRANYAYHREGLDLFAEKDEEGRKNILAAVQEVQKVSKLFPQSIAVISFLDAKKDELISVFTKGDTPVRRDAYNALVEIDPSQTDAYQAILKN